MENIFEVYQVYSETHQKVAKVALNGYNIEEGGPLGMHGALRSFKLIQGDLWQEWAAQEALYLHTGADAHTPIRIAAIPVEEDGFGLIEFL